MAKKIVVLALTLLFVCLVSSTALGYQSANVKDYLNFLDETEVEKIQGLIEQTVRNYNLDIVIVITNDTQGKSSRDYADDYYDYNGFGVGSDHSGLLMLVNMKDREVWVSTTGRAIDIFTDNRISDITAVVANFLRDKNYYRACTEFINKVAYYATSGVPQGQHRVYTETSHSYQEKVLRQMTSLPVYVIAFIISIIVTAVVSISSKGKMTVNNRTYEAKGSFALSKSVDDYVREVTTRTKIESESSSSSTHSSSSGRSHGGGGRSF